MGFTVNEFNDLDPITFNGCYDEWLKINGKYQKAEEEKVKSNVKTYYCID